MIDSALARRVRLLGLDVDGVLTDNGIFLGPVDGHAVELKRFDIQDGLGHVLMRAADIPVVWVSGRHSDATTVRARELRIEEVLQVPGHTPDAVAVLDSAAGYLWTGDTFYEAPIWLWFPETDWAAYERSVDRLAALAPELKRVFGAHNTPVADPAQLTRLKEAVAAIKARTARWEDRPDGLVEYSFDGFSVLTRKSYFVAPE